MKTIASSISILTVLALAALPVKAQVTYPGPGTANGGGASEKLKMRLLKCRTMSLPIDYQVSSGGFYP